MKSFLLVHTLLLPSFGIAGYVIQDDYNPSNFFSMFNSFTAADPTDGFVKFVDIPTGQSTGLITTGSTSVKMGADSKNVTPGGRPAIRIQSKASYSSGLIIADIAHMPGSICGAWPAFWTVGPNWPNNGEIDIIEGVNSATTNSMTLHTGPGCTVNSGSFSGAIKSTNCYVDAPGQGNNVGCGISASGSNTYGDPFNSAGGGVYATEWTAQSIAIYFFSRKAIPADITSGAPNPAGWGEPAALFQGGCNIPNSFKNHSIVFDTTFCGQWAGQAGVWGSDPVCSSKAATCNDYVQNNPSAFAQAYWEVNSIKVYQQSGGFIGTTPQSASSAAPPAASSSSKVPVPAAAPSSVVPVPPVASKPVVPPAASSSSPSPSPEVPAPAATSGAAPAPDTVPDTASASSSGIPIPFPQATKSKHRHHPKPSASASPPAAMFEIAPGAADGLAKGAVAAYKDYAEDRDRAGPALRSRHFKHMMAHRRGLHAH